MIDVRSSPGSRRAGRRRAGRPLGAVPSSADSESKLNADRESVTRTKPGSESNALIAAYASVSRPPPPWWPPASAAGDRDSALSLVMVVLVVVTVTAGLSESLRLVITGTECHDDHVS
jgi:hypothetical protein